MEKTTIEKATTDQTMAAIISADRSRDPVAPWWHTLLVLAALAGLSGAGARQGGLPNAHLPGLGVHLSSYFSILAAEWLLILFIWIALRRRGLSIATLVLGRWNSARDFFRDLGLGVGFIVFIVAIETGLGYLLHADSDSALSKITPNNALELVVWLALSATAGFCEEFIFRGYLMRQFSGWAGSWRLGNFLQAAAFGLCHGYYPIGVILLVVLHGWFLGMLTLWRKSLRPAMFAHGLQDALGGTVAFFSRG
jgi:uncharacterized protein